MDVPEHRDEEQLLKEPLSQDIAYRRSWKDKLKLIILPPLYFAFMVVAAVVVFFSVDALVESYQHKVRSIQDVTVEYYRTIGIALFSQRSATFVSCEFLYADTLYPDEERWNQLQPPNQICEHSNVTFFSRMLNRNRTAMVFKGPTLVRLKQSVALHFTMNTSGENHSAIEYLLLGYWDHVWDKSPSDQANYLTESEEEKPLFSVPAGFRTWIKMSYTIYNHGSAARNISDFNVHSDLALINNWWNGSETGKIVHAPLMVLFEWKGDTYEYITDILSTNVWNTVGSMAGMFVALIKVGEYSYRWIKRMRRERYLKAAEIEEQHHRKLDLYWRKKMERRLNKLASRLAGGHS